MDREVCCCAPRELGPLTCVLRPPPLLAVPLCLIHSSAPEASAPFSPFLCVSTLLVYFSPEESQEAELSRRRIFIIPAPLGYGLRPPCLARHATDQSIIETSPVHLPTLARALRSELKRKRATQSAMPGLIHAACATYAIKSTRQGEPASCVWCREAQKVLRMGAG